VVIVFSNGPDNASMVAPGDVQRGRRRRGHSDLRDFHQRVNKDPISSNVFRLWQRRTGGKAYWAKTWQRQGGSVRRYPRDLGKLYTVTYYPQTNPNENFRKIEVEIPPTPARNTACTQGRVIGHHGSASKALP
jgi:hypothetical protein